MLTLMGGRGKRRSAEKQCNGHGSRKFHNHAPR
jgi:hypothetical protein